MSDPHLVYLFKLAKRQGFIFDLPNHECNSACGSCSASPACRYIGSFSTNRRDWITIYKELYARADFSQSITTILDQHPEILV